MQRWKQVDQKSMNLFKAFGLKELPLKQKNLHAAEDCKVPPYLRLRSGLA